MVMTAEEAYAEAERRIEALAEGSDFKELRLNNLTALERLPSLSQLPDVHLIELADTNVSDISSLSEAPNLEILDLDYTNVRDLSVFADTPNLVILYLRGTNPSSYESLKLLPRLHTLWLRESSFNQLDNISQLSEIADLRIEQTDIRDLRPLLDLYLENADFITNLGLRFEETPAAASSPELTALSQMEDNRERTEKTLAYLRTLPPYPNPLPWDVPKQITIPQLLEAQDDTGWRFSPEHGTMSLFIRDEPLEARQEQLAKLADERIKHLMEKNGAANNSGGLRQEVAEEAARFPEILSDNSRSLNNRSLDLWGSLLALGGQLEAHDTGKRDGRDPLDLLTVEARTSLQTLLGVAGNLVRSFPEARALDDGNADFTRRVVTTDMVLALLEEAMRSKFVDDKSGALIQRAAGVSRKTGNQADKAFRTTATGGLNLAVAAILSVPLYVADGVASGVLNDICTEISNEQQLGERANAFIENARDTIEAMLDNSLPDEAARMRSALDDLTRNKGPR